MQSILESRLRKAQGSIRILFWAAFGTCAIFLTISISRVGEIAPREDATIENLELFVPPPPPPPPPPASEETPPKPTQIEMTLSLNSDKTTLAFQKLQTRFAPQVDLKKNIAFDFSKLKRPSTIEGMESMIFNKNEVDEAPRRTVTKAPDIPRKYTKGNKVLTFIVLYAVDEKGRPSNISILQSPNPAVNKYIIKTVSQWRCSPAKKDGKKVKCWVRHKITVSASSDSKFRI